MKKDQEIKELELSELPGGSHRMMFKNEARGRFKKRMPSFKGIIKFWKPTTCAMCYWWRLSFFWALAWFSGKSFQNLGIIAFFVLVGIGVYYGLRKKPNEI